MNPLPAFLLARQPLHPPELGNEVVSMTFLEKGMQQLSRVVRSGYAHWELARRDSALHRLDARVKVLFLAFFLVVVSLKQAILPEVGIAVFVLTLFLLGRVDVLTIYKRVLALGLLFGLVIPFPAMFNFLSDGEKLYAVAHLARSYDLWGYHVPKDIAVTREGLHGTAMLFLRVTNSAALSFLVLYTTPFTHIVKSLRVFRVPDPFVIIIVLSYKYLFIFARTIEEMHRAKRSRVVSGIHSREARMWVAERMTFLYRKCLRQGEEIFKAMLSRGFASDAKSYGLDRMAAGDWSAAGALVGLGALFLAW